MRMRMQAMVSRACWAGLVAVWPALVQAATDEPTYALSWSRGDRARECITSNALAKAVEARLGRSVFVSPAAAEFMLEARIDGGPSQWSATISLQDREGRRIGQRDLTSSERDCRALDQSLSLMLALAIDPNATLAVGGTPVESRAPPPALPSAVETAPAVAVRRTFDAPAPPRPALGSAPPPGFPAYAEGSFRLSFGMLPGDAVPGFAVAAVVPIQESWVIRVGAGGWLPAQAEGQDGGVVISQFFAAFGLCGRVRTTGAFLMLCAGAEPGLVAAAGYGFNQTWESDRRFALVAGPGGKVGVHLGGKFWAQLGGDLLVPIIRREFYYLKADDSSVEVFRSAAVTGAAELTVLLAFP
jgi:hypothetical protein